MASADFLCHNGQAVLHILLQGGDSMFFLLHDFNRFVFLLLHVDHAAAFPRALSKQEEIQCLEQLSKGDRTARDRLIAHNLRLVAHLMHAQSIPPVCLKLFYPQVSWRICGDFL